MRNGRHNLQPMNSPPGADSGAGYGGLSLSGSLSRPSTCHWGCPVSQFATYLPDMRRTRQRTPLAPKEMEKSLKEDAAHYSDRIHQLADELKKFGEQARNVEDILVSDSYMTSLSENLLQVVEKLSGQTTTLVPQPPTDSKPSTPSKPRPVVDPRTIQTENSRLRRELADTRAEVVSLSATVGYYVTKEREKSAVYRKWLQTYALEGRIFLYEVIGVHKAFEGWAREASIGRFFRKERAGRHSLATRCVEKAISQQNFTTVAMVFSYWSAMGKLNSQLKSLKERILRMKEAKLKSAELAFGGQDRALLVRVFAGWHMDAETTAKRRFRKEQVVAKAMRDIEKETNKVLSEILHGWQDALRKERAFCKRIHTSSLNV